MAEKCIDGATRLLEEADIAGQYGRAVGSELATKADLAATREYIDLRFDEVGARFDAPA